MKNIELRELLEGAIAIETASGLEFRRIGKYCLPERSLLPCFFSNACAF